METGVAQDQIAAFVDRILRLKEEAKALNQDIREIYAEAKGQGFDKTVLGKLVNYVEKRADKPNKLAEGEAIFDLYLTAYDSAKGRVGTKIARAHTHEKPEPQVAPQPAQSLPDTPLVASPLTEQGGGESSVTQSPETANETPSADARAEGRGVHNVRPLQDQPETANDTQATTPLSEDQGQRAAVSIAQEQRPAEANGLVKEPSEPEGSGGVQDRCESTPPTNSAPVINPRCQKAAQGDPCKFSHTSYSCAQCNQVAELKRAGLAA